MKWISNYLTDRKQQVVVSGDASSALPVISGVPQGSVLDPLLFIIYIDGVEAVTLSDDTVVMFADDIVFLYRPLHSQEDYLLLQRDIDAIAKWISNLHLNFNVKKCKYMVLSRKRSSVHVAPPALLLKGLPLERVSEFKYLGVRISSKLTWTLHINKICSKTKRLVSMFHRRFYTIMDTDTSKQLYVTYIRPHFEY